MQKQTLWGKRQSQSVKDGGTYNYHSVLQRGLAQTFGSQVEILLEVPCISPFLYVVLPCVGIRQCDGPIPIQGFFLNGEI
jgi:hypothetical protein